MALSELFGSRNRFGAFGPLSTAPQPISIKRMGFDCGTQAVAIADRTPFGRS
jgi:hypothetical protein